MIKTIIRVDNLCKKYNDKEVVDNLSFSAEAGDVIGLIGPNGAGKSTTMKIITRLISKSSGDIYINGQQLDNNSNVISRDVGFTSESPSFYNYLTGIQNLKLIANLYPNVDMDRIRSLLEFVGLTEAANKKVKAYSTGMKQRLGLARALLNRPKVIILDEPTNGLDPQGMREIYQLISKLAKEEKVTVIISSHLLYYLEKICNKIIVINHGKTVYYGNTEKIYEVSKELYKVITNDTEKVLKKLFEIEEYEVITSDFDSVTVSMSNSTREDLMNLLDDLELEDQDIIKIDPTLEDIFLMLVKEEPYEKVV